MLGTATRIGVLVLRMLGDAVLATPSLMALRQAAPTAKITAILEQRIAPLFNPHPAVDDLLLVPNRPTLAQKLHVRREIRHRRFDWLFNFHGGSTSALYAMACAGRRVGLSDYWGARWIYTDCIDPQRVWPSRDAKNTKGARALHKVEYRFSLLRGVGLDATPGPLILHRDSDAEHRMRAKLDHVGLTPATTAVVQPTALHPPKGWAVEKFGALCRHLIERHGLRVVITTGPGEDRFYVGVAAHLGGHEATHFHALTLPDFAALCRLARLYVGTDTGPSHVAAAAGCPSLVVYGPTPPAVWHPWGVPHRAVSVHPWCAPCSFTATCPRGEGPQPHCIATVTVDMATRAVDDLLAGVR